MRVGSAVFAAVIASLIAGCGGDDTTEADLSPAQEVRQIGDKWASLFAAAPNPDACAGFDKLHPYREIASKYMAQPACEQVVCERAGGEEIGNCTPLSPVLQKSFADATVQDVAIKGHRAVAQFSNGAVIRFFGGWHQYQLGPAWLVEEIGGEEDASTASS
jgi:hypothetical protein